VPFHRALLEERDFLDGRISTFFIDEHNSLIDRTRMFDAEASPLEPLYGGGEIAAAIAAGVVVASEG
jgi:pyruvate carboxylase